MKRLWLFIAMLLVPLVAFGQYTQPGGGGGLPSGVLSDGLGGLTAQGGISAATIGIDVQQPPYSASGFIVQTTTSNSVSVNATTIPVASSAGFSAGQVVVVALAGTTASSSTKHFAGFISSVSAGQIVLSTTAVTGASLPASCTSSATGIQTAIPSAGYLVYSLGSTTLSSGATVGATSITVANATSYSTNQGILITGAGTSGINNGDYVGTIASVSGNTINLNTATGTTVSSGVNVQHDDSSAVQTALNLGSVNANINIVFPDGVYQINGPLQDTTYSNCILRLPNLMYFPGGTTSGVWMPMATVTMRGVTRAPFSQDYMGSNTIAHWTGAILYTNRSSGSMIGGQDQSSWSGYPFTNVKLDMENLTLRTDLNTGITMVNAKSVLSG
jgi:hypothetical protein